jgi:hypothetical protein
MVPSQNNWRVYYERWEDMGTGSRHLFKDIRQQELKKPTNILGQNSQ